MLIIVFIMENLKHCEDVIKMVVIHAIANNVVITLF